MQYYLAIDLGAGSGRGIVYNIENNKIVSEEVHRFSGYDIRDKDRMYWNIHKIFDNILLAITNSYSVGKPVTSIGIDTWGVDYGVVNSDGSIPNPFHYRDKRTHGIVEEFDRNVIPTKRIYSLSGIAPNEFNTLYQLYKGQKAGQFSRAKHVGFISSLLGYMLTGNFAAEPTIASTSAFYRKDIGYITELLDAINFEPSLLPVILPTNTVLGKLKSSIMSKLNLNCDIQYIMTPAHDTAAAISAIPRLDYSKLFLSAGTWSLFGALSQDYVTGNEALSNGYSNELGLGNVRFLRNITGFWIIQECLKEWQKNNNGLNIVQVNEMIGSAHPSETLIDINNDIFRAPDNMLVAIDSYLESTGQSKLTAIGEYANCIYTSLALEYRAALLGLHDITGKTYTSLNIFGGGCQNEVVCGYTASSLNLTVFAGITEASSLGNAISQMIAGRELASLDEAHEIIENTYKIKKYLPTDSVTFDRLYAKYRNLSE